MDLATVEGQLRQFGQEHVLQFRDRLSPTERDALIAQLAEVDHELLARLYREQAQSAATDESPADKARRATPPSELVRVPRDTAAREASRRAAARGEELLRAGKVAAILVAGGEATRLGSPVPKGMVPIAPVSDKTLFQLLAEQLLARSKRAGAPIPYYVMTSQATHAATTEYFKEQNYFGLAPGDVQFFQQGNMPAIDRKTGRLLLAEQHRLAWNPDGHGGLLKALVRSGALADMQRRGIECIYYHQVDNPLARVCDPAFLGFHTERQAEVSVKVVAKTGPEEKMGVVLDVDGVTQIIEYSDLPPEIAAQRDGSELRFWAGSTAIHVFSRSFFDRLVNENIELPFHRAVKKVPCLDESGRLMNPETENAIKFERFIFDVLPLAKRSLVVEALRDEEFCPLKNKTGDFSPPFVQHGMSRQHAGWLRAAGVQVPEGVPVEISPLYALDPEELAAKVDRNLAISGPTYLK